MNDRQRLEAIVAVVCRYLPPDGISKEDAMREIIQLVDPLPEQDTRKEWVGLTDDERNEMIGRIQHDQYTRQRDLINSTQIITEMYLKEKNT